MSSKSSNSENLGFSYNFPNAGFMSKVRTSLGQFGDVFSEFNKFMSPQYDRCERSVAMRIYSMNKREILIVFLSFFACFGLGILIGLAGPPISNLAKLDASTMRPNQTSNDNNFLASGPFLMKTPLLSTYSQHLWLYALIELESDNANDNEIFDKSFQLGLNIAGINDNHQPEQVMQKYTDKNITRHLKCVKDICQEFNVLHLGFLEYAHFKLSVTFYGLFNRRFTVNKLTFFFKTYNPNFTIIEITFRFIFILFTFLVTIWFYMVMKNYSFYDYSLEQKWVSILLPLLILFNNPLYPLVFIMNSPFAGFLDAFFQINFMTALLLFWLTTYHGVRRSDRRFMTFYLPKLIIVSPLWLCAIVLGVWEKLSEMDNPTFSHFESGGYNGLKYFFYCTGTFYLLYLGLLILKGYSELRSMTLLMVFVLLVSAFVTSSKFGLGILEENFVAKLDTSYKSSAEFMCFYGLFNFYLCTLAFVYSPGSHELIHKIDNPSFSMLNDSDAEEVIDELCRPLNSKLSAKGGNEYDSD